ncbi:hypothetical protein SNE40_022255 [Patella caerulea]|uniref:Sulfite oxidase n=2 Tax=Patella caerulea TaxID=87958 RepID=A0AAN8J3W0_PATCE
MLNVSFLNRCVGAAAISKNGWRTLYFADNGHRNETQPFRTTKNYSSDHSTSEEASKNHYTLIGVGAVGALLGMGLYWKLQQEVVSAATIEVGEQKKGLPTYTAEDVAKHKTKDTKIWVTYKCGVYDITDYVSQHPGGSKIMMAVGGSIEPYWDLYAVHKNTEILEILETFRIGNIVPPKKTDIKDKNDPYGNEPKRNPVLIPSSLKPYNAEPPSLLLTEQFLTPKDLFFVRNHLPVPVVDMKSYRLEIGIEGKNKLKLNIDELKKNFPKMYTASVVQCAGNRRSEMTKIKAVKGLNWNNAAISNASWAGATLNDVMNKAGIDLDKCSHKHIVFEGMDKGPEGSPYGASLPIELARQLKNDILIAYEMNGTELPRDHGYPVRVIIPGVVGARQVKWLNNIYLSNEESTCHWQRKDYKGFNASVDWHNVDFEKSEAIQQLPVISSICDPAEGTELESGAEEVTVKGYAWSGGGRAILRVDISADGGKTWMTADLQPTNQSLYKTWAWTLWEATVPLPANHGGKAELTCKAVDVSYNCQPDNVEGIWNLRGVLSNAWHRVNVKIPS